MQAPAVQEPPVIVLHLIPLRLAVLLAALLLAALAPLAAQEAATEAAKETAKRWEPVAGQPGKDVVWVPTPDALVEKMLDMAQVTKDDFVIDLGSGDGRNVIAAAKRGARALGVEYNDKMVALSRELAKKAGVADRAEFVQGDMYAADISQATVLALFLLGENLDKLAPKFLDLAPGTRIVLNYFTVSGWTPDRSERLEKCDVWCTAHLYIVPAKVAGTWQINSGTLRLTQDFQQLRGEIVLGGKTLPVSGGRLEGARIVFTAGGNLYEGRVEGGVMEGTFGKNREPWKARRARAG
jgi:SAM-dependent methyltransferase